jgi:hypothetical protein
MFVTGITLLHDLAIVTGLAREQDRVRMWATCLAFVADASHGVDMSTPKSIEMTTEMSNFTALTQATLQLDEAERSVRVARIRLTTLVPGTPLRYGVEATRRLRAAHAELEAARIAYDAAQDLPASED